MGITATKVVKVAKAEDGYEEKRSNSQLNSPHGNAGTNNFTKYEKDLFGSSGNYWCASFVCWVFWVACNKNKSAVLKVLYSISMSCENMRQAFIKAKRYNNTPKVGDCVFFKGTRHAGANHIGIVIQVDRTSVTTMEGNTSSKQFDDNGGAVAKKTYPRNYSGFLGFGHPNYNRLEKKPVVKRTTVKSSTKKAETKKTSAKKK